MTTEERKELVSMMAEAIGHYFKEHPIKIEYNIPAPAAPAKAENVTMKAIQATVEEAVSKAIKKTQSTSKSVWSWMKEQGHRVYSWLTEDHPFYALYVPISTALLILPFLLPIQAGIAAGMAVGVLTFSIAEFGFAHDTYADIRDAKPLGADFDENRRTNEVVKMGTSLIFASCAIAKLIAFSPLLGIMAGLGALVVGILACVATDNKKAPLARQPA